MDIRVTARIGSVIGHFLRHSVRAIDIKLRGVGAEAHRLEIRPDAAKVARLAAPIVIQGLSVQVFIENLLGIGYGESSVLEVDQDADCLRAPGMGEVGDGCRSQPFLSPGSLGEDL